MSRLNGVVAHTETERVIYHFIGRHCLFNSQSCCFPRGVWVTWIDLSKDGLSGISLAVKLLQIVVLAKM